MKQFKAELKIIGVNPYVDVPIKVLGRIFAEAGRDKGPIPVHGTVNGAPYTQTLVRYAGEWRLYINTTMLKHSPKHVGETLEIAVDFDPRDRTLPLHPKLQAALESNASAMSVFTSLAQSRQHEINRYICSLKSEAKVDENVQRAINFLTGNGRFVGRDKP